MKNELMIIEELRKKVEDFPLNFQNLKEESFLHFKGTGEFYTIKDTLLHISDKSKNILINKLTNYGKVIYSIYFL